MVAKRAAVRVLIADDNALFRLGLARLLKDDRRLEVVADAADGQEAVEKASLHHPDVILMDARVLSSFENDGDVLNAMRRGAGGYVLKDSLPAAIINSILAVDAGERVLSEKVADRMIEIASGARAMDENTDGMTSREIEVLKLMSTGLANKQIAYRLKISEKTVRNHISHIYEKIGVGDRAQAALYAVRKGLIQP